MDLPKLNTSNVWDQTYLLLKDHIIKRKFAPNQKLSIPDLIEQLGVSRTPIRDAINRLETDGLLKTVARVGTYVVPIEKEFIDDIIDCRMMIEHWIVDKIPTLSKESIGVTLQEMNRILMLDHGSDTDKSLIDLLQQSNYDLEFHLCLVRMGGSKKQEEMYKHLMNYRPFTVGGPDVTQEMCEAAFGQHQDILEAFRNGAMSDLKSQITHHLNYSKQNIMQIMNENGGVL